MGFQDASRLARLAAVTAASAAILFAVACSRQPSPDAYAEPPPPLLEPRAELLGEGPAPDYYPHDHEGPDAPGAQADAGYPPPVQYAGPPGPPPPGYNQDAYATGARPPVVIAMEPIPNPPEGPPRDHRAGRHNQAPHLYTPRAERRAYTRIEPARRVQAETPRRRAEARGPRHLAQAPTAPATPKPAATKPVAQAKAAVVAPKPAPAKPVVKAAPPPAPVKPPAPTPKVAAAVPAAPPLVPPADRATKLAALQSALTQALARSAVLTAPQRFTAGKPAAVTLTIPAEFGDQVLAEAQKQGLSDVAASVNLTAMLSGDGFAVTPSETGAQPLTPGSPTAFAWQVTPRGAGRQPLHVDIGADLNGAGSESISLGSLKTAGEGFRLSPRVIGATLLVLIAGIVVAWLARGQASPGRRQPKSVSAAASSPPRPAPEPDPPKPAPEPVTTAEEPAANDEHKPA